MHPHGIWLTKAWHRNAHSACLCSCCATWIRYIHCFSKTARDKSLDAKETAHSRRTKDFFPLEANKVLRVSPSKEAQLAIASRLRTCGPSCCKWCLPHTCTRTRRMTACEWVFMRIKKPAHKNQVPTHHTLAWLRTTNWKQNLYGTGWIALWKRALP